VTRQKHGVTSRQKQNISENLILLGFQRYADQ